MIGHLSVWTICVRELPIGHCHVDAHNLPFFFRYLVPHQHGMVRGRHHALKACNDSAGLPHKFQKSLSLSGHARFLRNLIWLHLIRT